MKPCVLNWKKTVKAIEVIVNSVPSPQGWEGVETSGDVAIHLNNRISIQDCNNAVKI